MSQCYAYTRVSTVKQGEKGVSLQEQRAAIEAYAQRHGIAIVEWFEERLTAAKRGRPLFMRMLKGLRQREADGVVIHKIDRGARNLRDWAELGELIDAGIRIHFANESVDLLSRGGRLSADIQAVVAADYVRNLREETLKGINGRLKQGIFPFSAPLGYLDTGGGRVKAIDPIRAPLIREAFELYAAGRFSVDALVEEMYRRGLRNRRNHKVNRGNFSRILNNPYYAGILRLRSSAECFPGNHERLIEMSLFKRVQARLAGRYRSSGWRHDFTLRGLFVCSLCGRPLIGERQKGHVYYRCHTRACPTKSVREEALESAMLRTWPTVPLSDSDKERLIELLRFIQSQERTFESHKASTLQAELGSIKARRTRLVDAFVDGVIDKATYDERTRTLLEDQCALEDMLKVDPTEQREMKTLLEILELAASPQQSYFWGDSAIRRELAIRLCSNRSVAGKNVSVEPYFPLSILKNTDLRLKCGLHRTATRTFVEGGRHDELHRTATRFSVKDAWRLYSWARRWNKRQELLKRLQNEAA